MGVPTPICAEEREGNLGKPHGVIVKPSRDPWEYIGQAATGLLGIPGKPREAEHSMVLPE